MSEVMEELVPPVFEASRFNTGDAVIFETVEDCKITAEVIRKRYSLALGFWVYDIRITNAASRIYPIGQRQCAVYEMSLK